MAYESDNPSSETPRKRIKTQDNPENSPLGQPFPSQFGSLSSCLKGKSKLEIEIKSDDDDDDDDDDDVCGICLSEAVKDGKNGVSRGIINSCDHYFCFVCIMEWAKVESKCPLCKQRFSTIHRPAKLPLFPCDRLILVPVRDQVHNYLGNASTGPAEPYSDAECSVCHSSNDDSLLLLCDLCDCASHSYCVGFGATVPEGDWFCRDCTLLRDERFQTEQDTESSELTDSGNPNSSSKNITVFDIIKDLGSPIRRVERSSTSNWLDDRIVVDTRGKVNDVQDSAGLSARTMRQRRHVRGRIQELRNNWNSFRGGSLSFSSSSSSTRTPNQTCEFASHTPQPNSTRAVPERLNTENVPLASPGNRNIHEIDKAWKMFDIAKSMEQERGRKSILNRASKSTLRSKYPSANCQGLVSVNPASIRQEKKSPNQSLVSPSNKHKAQILEKRYQNCSTGLQISSSPGKCMLKSPQGTRSPLQCGVPNGNGRTPKKITAVNLTSATSNDCRKSVSSSSSVCSIPGPLNLSHAKLEFAASSSCKIEPLKHKDKGTNEKYPVDPKGNTDAKSEIQSLVKLNLKLLDKDKHLGVDAFKKVARSATHSILAACGLENPKPGIRHFPSSVCRHANDGLEIRRSTLMHNSCRECFYAFVKDVVSTIMLEKIPSADSS